MVITKGGEYFFLTKKHIENKRKSKSNEKKLDIPAVAIYIELILIRIKCEQALPLSLELLFS